MHMHDNIDPREPYKSSYVWDAMEKRGFPVSEHIKLIDLDDLTHEERLTLAGDDVVEIEKIIALKGDEFLDVMAQNMVMFLKLMFSLYEYESDEKKREILNVIRSSFPGEDDE